MRWMFGLAALLLLLLLPFTMLAATGAMKGAAGAGGRVVSSDTAPTLEQFAAGELRRFADRLLKADRELTFVVGTPRTNPAVARALGGRSSPAWPAVSEQGIVLKRATLDGRPVIIVGGGSPRATLWAVYELLERLGVRFLLDRDVYPSTPGALRLPDDGLAIDPNFPVRQWRVMNAHACGPESWGIGEYRPFIDQLAKLKFNRLLIYTWPWQPFVHFEAGGVRRSSATLWFGQHYPITQDMPGRALFGASDTEFWNPDIPLHGDYEPTRQAGERLIHAIMAHAHARGMECVVVANLGEFPGEFARVLKDARSVQQIGSAGTVVPAPNTPLDDPALVELASAVLRATVQTYPEAELVQLGMQEHRQWTHVYKQAWNDLDDRHHISRTRALEAILDDAANRRDYPGGAKRAVAEVQGDIVALDFFDRLVRAGAARRTDGSSPRLIFDGVAEELYPVLPQLAPAGSELLNFIDYTPSRILARRDALRRLPGKQVVSSLIYTLHDDNVGLLPQLATRALHELTLDLRKNGWAGFSTRYWLLGDHDAAVAYLARAAWDAGATPDAVEQDHVSAVYGDAAAAASMRKVFGEVEAATRLLETHGLGFAFPTPDMLMQHWKAEPLPEAFAQVERHYEAALDAARRAQRMSSSAGGPLTRYWIGRLEFGIGYLRAVQSVRQAAAVEAQGRHDDTIHFAQDALWTIREALEAYAAVARDRSDRGAIAVMAQYVYRPLQKKVDSLTAVK